MNPLTRLFRKPAWQSKNPTQRAAAVRDSDQPELLGLLAEFAQSDPEPQVRIAAMRRIDDLALLERRLRGEHVAEVAEVARERLTSLVLRRDVDADAAQAALRHVHDSALLTRVAEEAADAALRWLAMERIDRPTFWLQRAIHDPDAGQRLRILERIEDAEALGRLADAVRKRDKRLARAAREKCEALQLAAGDDSALRRQALALAESFGQLARALPTDREVQIQGLAADWEGLRGRLDADLVRRVDGAAAMAAAALAAARGEPVVRNIEVDSPTPAGERQHELPAADEESVPASPEHNVAPERADAVELPTLPAVDAEDFDAAMRAWAQAAGDSAPARQALRGHRQARKTWQADRDAAAVLAYAAALDRAEAALDAGHAGDARAAMPEGSAPAALRGRIRGIEERLGKLQHWQRWSTQSVRVRLCDEVEALHGSGMHPDALAQRLRDLQQEWSRLDGVDPIDPDHGLVKRFRGLCHRALAPARPYFEKRHELRSQHAEAIDALLAEAAPLPDDPAALAGLRTRVIAALRDLDEVPPQRRQALGRALRALRTAIDARQDAARADAEAAKRRVIAQLRRDLSALSGDTALSRAKQAQAEWKSLPRARREVEDALWTELRGLIDPLFEASKASQSAQQAVESERLASARRLIDDARALAVSDEERLQHLDSHVETLRQQWRALAATDDRPAPASRARSDARSESRSEARAERGPAGARRPPRQTDPLQALERDFDRALQAAAQASVVARQSAARQRIDGFVDWVGAWPIHDAGEPAVATWLTRVGCPAPLQAALLGLAADAGAGDGAVPEQLLEARRRVVRVELAAGLPSADEDAELRRGEQMKLLAEKLSGGAAGGAAGASPQASLFSLAAMPGLDHAARVRLLQRLRAALLAKPS